MKDQRKTEIRVGITVIIGLIILIWVFGWAKNFTLNSERKIITIEFPNTSGLEEGDPVTVNGVRKGYVDEIAIRNSKVDVVVNLDPEVSLKKDSRFLITMLDLMGGKKVEIIPGTADEEIDYNQIQAGNFLGDIATAMAAFGYVEKDLIDVIKDVKITLISLNKTLSDEKFNANLRQALDNLVVLTANLNRLLLQNRKEINDLLVAGTKLTKSVNEFIETNKDSIAHTITSLKKTLDDSRILIGNVNMLLDETNRGENTLGRALKDQELLNDIKASLQNLKELTRILLEQLKKEGIKVDADINLF